MRGTIPYLIRTEAQMQVETIRPATEADLPHVADVWHHSQADVDVSARPPGIPSLYRHELATRELHVAERDGRVVAFAALLRRGSVAFLADLFVRADQQSSGLGRRLLAHVLPRDGSTCCTVASSDPRALALYVRFGMRPRWPNMQLLAHPSRLQLPRVSDVEIVQASSADPELRRWDTEIGGRPRALDHAYWMEHRGGISFWLARGGRRIGYGFVQTRSDDLLEHTDAMTLGPIGVASADDAVDAVLAAVRRAADRGVMLRIGIPGPHPALAPLLQAGFRISYVETFCCTDSPPFADFERYLPSGSDLF